MSLRIDMDNGKETISFPFKKNVNGSREWPINLELEKNGEIYYAPLYSDDNSPQKIPKPLIGFTFPNKNSNNISNELYLFNKEPYGSSGTAFYNTISIPSMVLNNKFSIVISTGRGYTSYAGQPRITHWEDRRYVSGYYYGQPIYSVERVEKVDQEEILPENGSSVQSIKGVLDLEFLRFGERLHYEFGFNGGIGGTKQKYQAIQGSPGKTITISAKETCRFTFSYMSINFSSPGNYFRETTGAEQIVKNKAKEFSRTQVMDNWTVSEPNISVTQWNLFR
jgi:hypothetical protein